MFTTHIYIWKKDIKTRPGDQSHENPCSVAALLRGNFGNLVDFTKNFTKIHAVLLQNSLQVSRCFHRKIPKINILFWWKISTKTAATLLEISTKKLPLWLISTKKCLYGKFPQKKLALWKISTKLCFVGKFPQQQALLKNFRKKSCFVRTFPQNLVYLGKRDAGNSILNT